MLILFSVVFILAFKIVAFAESYEKYFHGKIPKDNMRYNTFKIALKLLSEREAKTIVETGTARAGAEWCLTDGGSTLIFGNWANDNGATLYSIDIDKDALLKAERALGAAVSYTRFVHSDSIQFLHKFDQSIDFLYLDSFDFEIGNPISSQKHHLEEIMAAYPLLTENSIVMIDDCDLPHGGKGKFAIIFLQRMGWKIMAEGYQVILVKDH